MRLSARSILLASAAVAALAFPALADSYFFRTKPLVEAPQAFAFGQTPGQNPGASVVSDTTRVKGHRGKTASVTGGEYQICATADCSGASWTSAATPNVPADFHARMRVTAPAFGGKVSARFAVGDASATYEVGSRVKDTTPSVFGWAGVTGTAGKTYIESSIIGIDGHDGVAASISAAGAAGAQFKVCSDASCASIVRDWSSANVANLSPGQYVGLRVTAAAVTSPVTVTFHAGDASGIWVASPAPVPVATGSRGDYEWRCNGGLSGKICRDPQVRPLASVGWGPTIFNRGSLSADQWFAFWNGDVDENIKFFCHVATGNTSGQLVAGGVQPPNRPFFIAEFPCSDNNKWGSCKDVRYTGTPKGKISFFERGSPTANVQCNGF